eukprot:Seg1656.10 transcript_id=Seg1656.10/GoldUCD/mRNA.D3Y31 product="Serine palmitoyltransferase 1" protein_id=Seg1656.10/GoldUCD/D3Y31
MADAVARETLGSNDAGYLLSLTLLLTKIAGIVENTVKVPFYHILLEAILILWIIRLLTRKSYTPKEQRLELSKEEEDVLIQEWEPEPLVPRKTIDDYILNPKVVQGKAGKKININGEECLNLSTFNFLGFVGKKEIEENAVKTLRKYGVGSCGPRGFYGTIDVHLHLEEKISAFLGTEEAALYSYGFSTIASVIPAYSKRTDIIFCDDGVGFAIQKGILASRSKVYWFRHNDMADLERKLKEQEQRDIKNPKKAKVTRRFLVVEGLYANYGDIAPLPKLIELKKKYKVRIIIDETMSFGVLGEHGKGITDHHNIPIDEIDMMAVSLESSLATVGGFSAGTSFVVDHQRLAGQGYSFSASLPPLLATAADSAFDLMKENPGMFAKLRENATMFRKELQGITGLSIDGASISPIIHLRLTGNNAEKSRDEQEKILLAFVDEAYQEKIALTMARYLNDQEIYLPMASIRLTVNSELSEDDISTSADTIKKIAKCLLG